MNIKFSKQNIILLMVAFFTLSFGLWDNYRQLWLQTNNFSSSEIAKIFSYASFISVLYLFYFSKTFSFNKIKSGIFVMFIIKIIASLSLFFLNNSNMIHLIKTFFFIDCASENIIFSCFYPLLISYKCDSDIFSKNDIIQYIFKCTGVLISTYLFGRIIFGYLFSYNSCLLLSIFFCLLSFVLIFYLGKSNYNVKNVKISFIKSLSNDKLTKLYFIHRVLADSSYYFVFGLLMLVLTNYVKLSVVVANYYFLILSVIACFVGYLSLNVFRFKNDYISLFLKLGVRLILYICVFITNNIYVLLIATSYALLTLPSYSYLIDGYCYSKIKKVYILDFVTYDYIFYLIARSIALFIVGYIYNYGFRYMYLASAIVLFIDILLACYIIKCKDRKD